jgi:hypothetical protein
MAIIKMFNEWVSTSTHDNINPEMEYTSKDKIYYGIHTVTLSRNGVSVDVKAKFDTGARSSSIDFSVGEKLGLSKELIERCKELDHLDIPKTISKKEQKSLEKQYTKELKSEFPEITKVQMSKSSSGFSVRAYIKLDINYYGNHVSTEVNLRDRTGLSCEMLVGLKDML